MLASDLIFDIGVHKGEDTEFYLKKGFRVVGVEPNPVLYAELTKRFSPEITAGRLTLVNKAIAEQTGFVTFYINPKATAWGTLNASWAERNERKGFAVDEIQVKCVKTSDLVAEFGVPYYIKIDIEGHDVIALKCLAGAQVKPKYISIESDKVSFNSLREEFNVLSSLGYTEFALVNQRNVPRQKSPRPSKEGNDIDHVFIDGASGVFGAEISGPWLSEAEAIEAYRPIFLRYALVGDDPFLTNKWIRRVLRRAGFRAGWYDTHARRPG